MATEKVNLGKKPDIEISLFLNISDINNITALSDSEVAALDKSNLPMPSTKFLVSTLVS